MCVPATPRPSPTKGAQIAAAMRFPAADAGHPGQRPGAHDVARSVRDAPAGGQRLLGGPPQFICFAGAPLAVTVYMLAAWARRKKSSGASSAHFSETAT